MLPVLFFLALTSTISQISKIYEVGSCCRRYCELGELLSVRVVVCHPASRVIFVRGENKNKIEINLVYFVHTCLFCLERPRFFFLDHVCSCKKFLSFLILIL